MINNVLFGTCVYSVMPLISSLTCGVRVVNHDYIAPFSGLFGTCVYSAMSLISSPTCGDPVVNHDYIAPFSGLFGTCKGAI
jgi:hypothetical protein